jgi:hypothetical protein
MTQTHIEARGQSGTVIFDGMVVTIDRNNLIARATVGKGIKQIAIGSVSAVQWKPAGWLVNGYLELTLSGGQEVRSRAGRSTRDAGRSENAVTFTRGQMPAFERLRGVLQGAMNERRR